jgi:hypothetical protein
MIDIDRNDIRAVLEKYPDLASNEVEQELVEYLEDAGALTSVQNDVKENHQPDINILNVLITRFPEELGFSLLMATIRFPTYSDELMNSIFDAIDTYYEDYWDYELSLIQFCRYHDVLSKKEDLISHALKYAFDCSENRTIQWSGNLHVIKLIRKKYPRSILTDKNDEDWSPLCALCCERAPVDLKLIRYFIEWYLDIDPDSKGGLFNTVPDSVPIEELLTKSQPILPLLQWMQSRGLMFRSRAYDLVHYPGWNPNLGFTFEESGDDHPNLLFCCLEDKNTPIENIQFFLNIYPKSILSTNYIYDGDYYPIQILIQGYTDFGYTKIGDHSSLLQFLDKFKLLLRYGLNYGLRDFGGLFNLHYMQDDNTIDFAHYAVGNENGRLLLCQAISECLNDLGADYEHEPIVHAAIDSRKKCIEKNKSKEGWLMILRYFRSQDQLPQYHMNMHGDLPLHHALKEGLSWDDGLSDIVTHYQIDAIGKVDASTGLYPFMLAATGDFTTTGGCLYTTFRLLKEGPEFAKLYGSYNKVSQPNEMDDEIVDGGDEEPQPKRVKVSDLTWN